MLETDGRRLVVSAASFFILLIHRSGLLRRFQDEGYSIIAAAPAGRGEEELKKMGIETVHAPIDAIGTNPFADLRLLRFYEDLFRRERPAVYVAFTVKPNIFGTVAAHRNGVPSINNISGLGRVFNQRTMLTRLVEQLYRWGLRSSRVVFFENRDDERHFLDRHIIRREQAVPLAGAGLDLSQFSPSNEERPAGAPLTFLFAARLLWSKGTREFVEAARALGKERSGIRFQILGFPEPAGRDSVPLHKLRQWHDEQIIEYLGGTTDVRPFLAASDCVVLPTFYREGVPRILMEGAAMAKPLIATEMPGCRDVVDHGLTGYLCKPRSSESLAAAMARMAGLDPAERAAFGRAGRAKMVSEFDERLVHAAYIDALSQWVIV